MTTKSKIKKQSLAQLKKIAKNTRAKEIELKRKGDIVNIEIGMTVVWLDRATGSIKVE